MAVNVVNASAVFYGSNSLNVTSPAVTNKDCIQFFVAQKENLTSGPIICNTAGVTKIGEVLASAGVAGPDTGPTRIAAFIRVIDGTEPSLTYNFTVSSDVAWGIVCIHRITNPLAVGYWIVDAVSGSDLVGNGPWSATMDSALNLAVGDFCMVGSAIPTDINTPSQFSAELITATGFTFGAMNELVEPDTGVGNDMGGFIFYQSVTAGATADVIPVVTATVAGAPNNVYGGTIIVRFRFNEGDHLTSDTTYLFSNIGAVDSTSLLPRDDSTYEYYNIAAFEVAGTIVQEGWAFRTDLTGRFSDTLPIDGDASTYIYINIT